MSAQHHDFGKYKLLRRIASGGMGEVHLAKLTGPSGFEKLVVIKRLLQSRQGEQKYIDMFFSEARVAAQLGHSNIVQIYEVGTIDETPYIAMEYVHGKSLRKVMDTAQKRPTSLGKDGLPPGFIAYIVSQLCAGLAFAHDARHLSGATIGLVHRDINPHNVLISYQGEVKIIDFGIAKSELTLDQTQAGTIKGTVVYMSPEQSMGEKLDKRSDLFSVGICLYEALTGKNPFHKSGMGASLEAIRQAEVPPLPPEQPQLQPFAPILTQALARRREQRFADCSELGERLKQLIETGQVARPPVPLASYMAELFGQEMFEEERLLERTDLVRNPLLSSNLMRRTQPLLRATPTAQDLAAAADTPVPGDAQAPLGSDRTVATPMASLFGAPAAAVKPPPHKPQPARAQPPPLPSPPPVAPVPVEATRSHTPSPLGVALQPLLPWGRGALAGLRQLLTHPELRAFWPYIASLGMMFAVLGAIVVVTQPQLRAPPNGATPAAVAEPNVTSSSAGAGSDASRVGRLAGSGAPPLAAIAPKVTHEPVATLAIDEDAYLSDRPEPREALAPQNQEHRPLARRRSRDADASREAALQVVAEPPLAVLYEGRTIADGSVTLHGASGALQLGQNPDSDPFIVTLHYRATARGLSFEVASIPWANVSGPGGIALGRTPLSWTEPGSTLSLEFKNPHVDVAQRVTLRLGPREN